MRIRNLAATATLIPVLALAGCGRDDSADVAASSPGAHKIAKYDAANSPGQPEASRSDPVVSAYYTYRAALDVMMRSGGRTTKQLRAVMTPELFRSISHQAEYYRSKKLHNTGTTQVLWAKRTLLANGVVVRACYDTAQARTVFPSGRNALPDSAPTRWLDEMRVQQVDGRWVVGGGRTYPEHC